MPDMDLGAFIGHVAGAIVRLDHAEHQAMEQAALVVEKRAKAILGEYQAQGGPFAAWAELADSTKADRVRHGFPENEPLLRTGHMRDSIDHKVIGNRDAVVGSDDPIAEYQELGTSRIPPRSFLGAAAVQKGPEVAQIIGLGTVQAFTGLIGQNVYQRYIRIS